MPNSTTNVVNSLVGLSTFLASVVDTMKVLKLAMATKTKNVQYSDKCE